ACHPGKIEVAVAASQVERAVEAIQNAAKTGQVGDGRIFVSALDQAVRLVQASPATLLFETGNVRTRQIDVSDVRLASALQERRGASGRRDPGRTIHIMPPWRGRLRLLCLVPRRLRLR